MSVKLITPSSKIHNWIITTFIFTSLCIASFSLHDLVQSLGFSVFFESLFFQYDFPASLVFLFVLSIAFFCIDRRGRMGRAFEKVSRHSSWLAMGVLLITALGSWFVYHTHPLSMDEYAPSFQSEIFASGHLVGNVPIKFLDTFVFKGFQGSFLEVSHTSGAVASAYWPGLAVVMTPFTLLGVSWLCNPVLSYLTILLLARLLNEVVVSPAAKGYALLATAFSPAIVFNGMSFYGMPLQLLCCIGFTLGMIRGTPRYLLFAGFSGAMSMVAVNPFPFFLYALPWVYWFFLQENRSAKSFFWVILGGLPIVLVLGIGWKFLVAQTFQDEVALNSGAALSVFSLPSYRTVIMRGIGLAKLWLWAVPGLMSLAFLAYFFKANSRWVKVFMQAGLLSLIGYLFVVFDQGHGWGYRYFHTAWLVLPVLAAVAFEALERDVNGHQQLYGFAMATCIGTAILLLPYKATQVEAFVAKSLDQVPARVEGNSRQLVFLRLTCHAMTDMVQNTPYFNGNELRLVSGGTKLDTQIALSLGTRPRIVENFPCAQRWVLD